MSNQTEIKIRGYHVDMYGHVNNARYLEFLEEARWARLESQIDLNDWAARKLAFFIVNININYRKGLMAGDTATITTGIDEIKNKSAVLKQIIIDKRSGEVSADALITFVIIDDSGRAVVLNDGLREEIEKLG